MNRILIASAFVLGVSGAAIAQQAPYTIGNFSAAVEQSLNPGFDIVTEPARVGVDTMTTATIPGQTVESPGSIAQPIVNNRSIQDEYGGR